MDWERILYLRVLAFFFLCIFDVLGGCLMVWCITDFGVICYFIWSCFSKEVNVINVRVVCSFYSLRTFCYCCKIWSNL